VVSGKVVVVASAVDPPATRDGMGISKVQFLVDGLVKRTDTSADYTYSFDASKLANGTHTITAVAYDTGDPSSSSTASIDVTVAKVDTTKPSTPAGFSAAALDAHTIRLRWKASTDDESGVARYEVRRDGVRIASALTNGYDDGGLGAGSRHSYTVVAVDGVGNVSSSSPKKSATTLKN
jgi:cellulose 1,4-beta-cellobiosidase